MRDTISIEGGMPRGVPAEFDKDCTFCSRRHASALRVGKFRGSVHMLAALLSPTAASALQVRMRSRSKW
jgi:hypothetical protein